VSPQPSSRSAPSRRRASLRGAAGALLLAALAACAPAPTPEPSPAPGATRPLPSPPRPEPAELEPATPSPASLNMHAYLAGVEERLAARGLLRADDGREVAVDAAGLAQIFVNVALRDEYVREGGRLVRRTTPAPLRRWAGPLRFQIEYGDSVTPEQRRKDRASIAGLAARLQSASGHPAALTGSGGNFTILILNEDERRAIGPHLADLVPGMPVSDTQALTDLSPQIFCTVFTYSQGVSPVYTRAVAVIRAELPPRLRSSCLHEEMAQGLGLANDDPGARPSIFNDDEEFAHLTWLDELLLKILYDRRLQPGMQEAEALPLIRQIAAELIPPPEA